MLRTRCGRRKELLFTSPPAVAAAATARATATASGSAPALAPAPPVARTEHRGTLLAAEETSARPAARAYFGRGNSAGTREACVEINQCIGCTRQFFTKSFIGDDAAVLARSSGEEPASSRHRAGIASMAWSTTR